MLGYSKDESELHKTNLMLVDTLFGLGKKVVYLSSLGNSIATGFSMTSSNVPLLRRNDHLITLGRELGIKIHTFQFARSENNNAEQVFRWLSENKTVSEFNDENRRDYLYHIKNGNDFLTKREIVRYYPEFVLYDVGTQDIIFAGGTTLANIVILNIGTGSFLDNWTRGGEHTPLAGMERDRAYIRSILTAINEHNRASGTHTQVYLCGAPRILGGSPEFLQGLYERFGLGLTNWFMNNPIKKITREFPNVTYVPNFSRKAFYYTDDEFKYDIHYDEDEYLRLLNMVEQSVIHNYEQNSYLIYLDRYFAERSKQIEMSGERPDTRDEILSVVDGFADRYRSSGRNCEDFLNNASRMLLARYPYDYYFMDRNAIREVPKVLAKRPQR